MIYRKFIASLLTIALLVGVVATPVTASASSRVADTTPPIVTYPSENQTFRIRMGEPFIMDILASHSEERTLTYNLASYPSSLRLDPHSGRVTWTPDDSVYLRKNEVTFYVEEDRFGYTRGRAVYHTFFIEVLDEQQEPVSDDPPVHAPAPAVPSTTPSNYQPIVTYPFEDQTFRIRMGEPFIIDILASHPEERPLTYELASHPSSLRMDPHSGRVTWTPNDSVYLRKNEVSFYVKEDHPGYTRGRAVYHKFFIEVLDEQQGPAPTEQLTQPGPAMVQPSTNQPSDEIIIAVEPSPDFPTYGVIIGDDGPESELLPGIPSYFFPGTPSYFFFEAGLRRGDFGRDVLYLQRFLNRNGFQVASSGAGSPGEETPFFGFRTEAAVIKFQNHYSQEVLSPWGLTQGTGIVNSTTREKINELLIEEYAAASDDPYEDDKQEEPVYWQQREMSLGDTLMMIDLVAASSPIPPTGALTASVLIKRAPSGIYRAWQGSKVLRFTIRGIRLTDETFSGLVQLERRIKTVGKAAPWFTRALRIQRDVLNKMVGYENLAGIESAIRVGNTTRRVDAIVRNTVNLGGKTLKKGDLLEIKDFWSHSSILKGMSGQQKLIRQIVDYAEYAKTTGNKVFVAFTKPQQAGSLKRLDEALRKANVDDMVEIINGL